jgi:uncharacterized repeat protein (TIGR03803 family)
MTPEGMLKTVHSFRGKVDGSGPGGLVQATDGNFYGATSGGGANGYGTIFKMTPAGTLTPLHSFDGADGSDPVGLAQATDGNFYGTTLNGGTYGQGTVFTITPAGTLTTLYNFCSQPGCTDGIVPGAAPVQATDGNFYGTTTRAGANWDGTVFSLSVGLGPFVETSSTLAWLGSASLSWDTI